jgi:hypothetical protein
MALYLIGGGPKMSHSALLIIDVQQSFQHRPFWQEDDLPGRQLRRAQQRGSSGL